MKTVNERACYIDILSGVLILHMIMGHYQGMANFSIPYLSKIMHDFLFFFMPWFFFKSGMFFRFSSNCLSYTFKRLFVPFVSFSILGSLLKSISILITAGHGISNGLYYDWCRLIYVGSTNWNAPLWFLFSLFCVRNIYNYFSKYSYTLLCLAFVASVANYYFIDHANILIGGNICSGLFFYSLGDILRRKQFTLPFFLVSVALYLLAVFV